MTPTPNLQAAAMREKAAALFTIPEAKHVADRIRAIPTTFTHAELLAAAMEMDEVRALAAVIERLNAACDAMWNDHERLEKNAGYFADQQPWQLKEVHILAISEAQQCLPAALAPFARKAGV